MSTTTQIALSEEGVYFGDNGRAMCLKCAGYSARTTGRDLSGSLVSRASIEDVKAWPSDLGPFGCECGNLHLSAIANLDGWPLRKAI